MSMFNKYNGDQYTPYNLTPPSISRGVLTNFKTPLYTLNKQGNIDRFYWVDGEEFNLNLRPTQKIRVPKGSLILSQSGDKPSYSTEGTVGMKCYNTADYISWTCTSEEFDSIDSSNDRFVWTKDNMFECLECGGEEIKLTPSMKGKTFKAEILNFRHEVIYEYEAFEDGILSIRISKEETPLLVQGQYHIRLFIISEISTDFIVQFEVTILGNIDRLAYTILTNNYYILKKEFREKKNDPEWGELEDDPFAEWSDVDKIGQSSIEWEHIKDDIDIDISKFVYNWGFIG